MPEKFRRLSLISRAPIFGFFLGVAVVLAWSFIEWRQFRVPAPFEDAAMLYRYAQNLGNGLGLSWNPGEYPGVSDGATDLGYVLLLSGFVFVGFSVTFAGLIINVVAAGLVGFLVFLLNRVHWKCQPWLPSAVVILIMSGPASRYILSGFSPLILSVLYLSIFLIASKASTLENERIKVLMYISLGSVAGLSGWWRPEGFYFGLLILVLSLFTLRKNSRTSSSYIRLLSLTLIPYLALATGWIYLRIAYFGNLLPTSAVMKAGNTNLLNIVGAQQLYLSWLLPLLAVLIYLLATKKYRYGWVIAGLTILASGCLVGILAPSSFWQSSGLGAIPVIAFIATLIFSGWLTYLLLKFGQSARDLNARLIPLIMTMFILPWGFIETSMNWWYRMQWPILPFLVVFITSMIVQRNPHIQAVTARALVSKKTRTVVLVGLYLIVALFSHLPRGGYFEAPFQSAVSETLKRTDTRNMRVVTTEAGLIPLAIDGVAFDSFGWNTRSVANSKDGEIIELVNDFKPNVIIAHSLPVTADAEVECKKLKIDPFDTKWNRMTSQLVEFATLHNFSLLRSTETDPCDTWNIWVDNNLEKNLVNALKAFKLSNGVDLVDIGNGSKS